MRYRPDESDSIWERLKDRQVLLFLLGYIAFLLLAGFITFSMSAETVIHRTISRLFSDSAYAIPKMDLRMPQLDSDAGAVRIELMLGVAKKDKERIEKYMPMIMDRIYTCLNEVTIDQLKRDPEFRLIREDMLREINKISGPVKVNAIYIRKLLTP